MGSAIMALIIRLPDGFTTFGFYKISASHVQAASFVRADFKISYFLIFFYPDFTAFSNRLPVYES